MPFGAEITDDGSGRFRLLAPAAQQVDLALTDERGIVQMLPMNKLDQGWYELLTDKAHAGSLYKYRIDGKIEVPDPASRRNPTDVHGPSEVVDPNEFDWPDDEWRSRPWHE